MESLNGKMNLPISSTYEMSCVADGTVTLCRGVTVPASGVADPAIEPNPCNACGIAPINCDNWLCAPPAAASATATACPPGLAGLVVDGGSPNGVTAAATADRPA